MEQFSIKTPTMNAIDFQVESSSFIGGLETDSFTRTALTLAFYRCTIKTEKKTNGSIQFIIGRYSSTELSTILTAKPVRNGKGPSRRKTQ